MQFILQAKHYLHVHLFCMKSKSSYTMLFLILQAGYVVHEPEPVYSACGNFNNEESTCSVLKYALNNTDDDEPTCYSNTPIECFNLNSSNWNYIYNANTDSTCQAQTCSHSSICSCGSTQDNTCQMSRISQPSPPNTKPTVTVWYNNQVSFSYTFSYFSGEINIFSNFAVYIQSRKFSIAQFCISITTQCSLHSRKLILGNLRNAKNSHRENELVCYLKYQLELSFEIILLKFAILADLYWLFSSTVSLSTCSK